MEAIKRFKVDIGELSDSEKKVLEKLIKASELIAPLYERQKNPKYKGANFYPPDVKKEEIREAAEKNPLILHPYTFVERDGRGRLVAIPFCVKFKRELKEITKLLEEAARISKDKDFGQYLKDLARSLLRNDYAKNEILWVTRGPFKIDFMIGPVERYFDRLFFKKCAYQAWVGISDEKRLKEIKEFKKIVLASRRKIFPETLKIRLPKLRVGINKTILFAGQKAAFMTFATNLPNDSNLMEKYGSRFEIFDSPHWIVFENQYFPILKTLFDKKIQKAFSKKELYLSSLRSSFLHEISHTLIRYRDSEQRLEEIFPIFDELLAEIFGIKCCGLLFLKGFLSQKELEAIILMKIVRNFYLWLGLKESLARIHYAIGGAIAQNFFARENAIKEKDGILFPDFTKLFISIDHLSRVLEYYLSSANYKEAKKFVDEYGSFKIFEKFSSKLKNIPK